MKNFTPFAYKSIMLKRFDDLGSLAVLPFLEYSLTCQLAHLQMLFLGYEFSRFKNQTEANVGTHNYQDGRM